MKDEKILKEIGKLLTKYGASEEEKSNFIEDVKALKYDDEEEEIAENPTQENEDVEESSVEGGEPEGQEQETTEQEQVDPSIENEQVETPNEEVANDSEEVVSEEAVEQPIEETQETPTDDYKEKYEEALKSIEGLSARIESLENVVSKLGVVKEDETVGASPTGTPIDESPNDSFNEIIRKRIG